MTSPLQIILSIHHEIKNFNFQSHKQKIKQNKQPNCKLVKKLDGSPSHKWIQGLAEEQLLNASGKDWIEITHKNRKQSLLDSRHGNYGHFEMCFHNIVSSFRRTITPSLQKNFFNYLSHLRRCNLCFQVVKLNCAPPDYGENSLENIVLCLMNTINIVIEEDICFIRINRYTTTSHSFTSLSESF